MQFSKHIYLTGFMGCGKSTLGKKLAGFLNTDFVDLDKYISLVENKSVDEIFETLGETYFRNAESQSLEKISAHKSPQVIALGGGTICFNNNLNFIKTNGILIYIELSTKTLLNRLQNSKETRPLIKNLTPRQLENFVEIKLAERLPFYTKAHITLNGLNLSAQQIANNLFEFLKKNS